MSKSVISIGLLVTSIALTGCNELDHAIAHIENIIKPQELSPEQVFRKKLKDDLRAFERIATVGEVSFIELEASLRKAAKSTLPTDPIKQELQSFANQLSSQNEAFKLQHFQTNDGAKLRNKMMQLNYATIQLIHVMNNPQAFERRLERYLKRQQQLITEYKHIKNEMKEKI